MRLFLLLLSALAIACSTASSQKSKTEATPAPQAQPQNEDPFLWLEEVEGEKALAWVHEQNGHSLPTFQKDARYDTFLNEADTILNAKDKIPYGALRGGHVYNFWQDDKNIRGLWRRTTLEDYRKAAPTWDVILDFDALAKTEDKNWVYKGVRCLPPQYNRCMLRLSDGGTDASTYREFDVASKSFVADGFVVPNAKSSVAWLNENTLFLGTDWGDDSLTDSGYPRIVKMWQRGTPLADAKTIHSGAKADVGVWPFVMHEPGSATPMIARSMTFYTSQYFIIKDDHSLLQLPIPESAEFSGRFADQFLFTLREAWQVGDTQHPQGALLSFSASESVKTGKLPTIQTLLVPDARTSIEGITETKDHLLITTIHNVKGKILQFAYENNNWSSAPVDLPQTGSLSISSANPFINTIFINYEDHITPDTLYEFDADNQKSNVLKTLPARFNAEGLQVHQYEAKSKDGEMIPYFVIHHKDVKLDGKNPTVLYGYGGFEISLVPRYSTMAGKLWLERGGIYAIANIRGGGEFGPRWHKAALKEKRQRAYDDFAAVAEDLATRKLTSPEHLGIMGGSNGGLLMGVAFTQRPDLYKAVVCQVPLLDMFRYTKLLAGASWAGEYGDPEDPVMRAAIAKYSPYQNVVADKAYPEVFFVTSTKDDRVHPGHARKMVAKMKAQGHKVFYYENTEGGHAAGANLKQHAKRYALEFTYFSQQLGLP